jgi:hypothetical protein
MQHHLNIKKNITPSFYMGKEVISCRESLYNNNKSLAVIRYQKMDHTSMNL